jgi:hypothetical protein
MAEQTARTVDERSRPWLGRADFTTTPSPRHPIGANGVGESPNVGGVSAFSNAVNDGLRPSGPDAHADTA